MTDKSDHDLLIQVCRDVNHIQTNELAHIWRAIKETRATVKEVRNWVIGGVIGLALGIIGLIIERLVG